MRTAESTDRLSFCSLALIFTIIGSYGNETREQSGNMAIVTDKAELLKEVMADPEHALRVFRGGDVPVQMLRDLAAHHQYVNVQIFLAG